MRRLRVLIAPDKFKSSLSAPEAAAALAEGWLQARPDDEVVLLPMADGGDGSAAVLAQALPDPRWVPVLTVNAVGAPRTAAYLRAGDTAVIELAGICGLAGLARPEPMDSHTVGLGIVLSAASKAGARRLLVALGGSASTDGGTGALSALGARWVGAGGRLPIGGRGLPGLVRGDLSRLRPRPPDGVDVLADVSSPLFGPAGAPAVFGPQKGAGPDQVADLDVGLRRFAALLGTDPDLPGAGAAGGTGYGLAHWGARLLPGATTVGQLIGLPAAIERADLVITGEGRFDASSLTGKACGHVLASTGPRPCLVIAGSVAAESRRHGAISLSELSGSTRAALAEPSRWLAEAARRAAAAR